MLIEADGVATVIATDGAAKGRQLCSAWLSNTGAAYIRAGKAMTGLRVTSLDLHAELYALAHAEATHPKAVTLLTDCQSAVSLIERWQAGTLVPIPGYRGRSLIAFSHRIGQRVEPVTVRWVRGHARHPLNEGADALASLGLRARRDGLSKVQVRERAMGIAVAFAAEFAAIPGVN